MKRWLLPLLIISCLFSAESVCKGEGSWKVGVYFKRQVAGDPIPVTTLLHDFGKAQKVAIVNDPEIQGAINVQYPPMPPEEYLDAICQDNGLIWYDSGGVIYVYPTTMIESRVLGVNSVDLDKLVAVLRQLGVYSDRFQILTDEEFGIVYAVGPPKYLEEVEKIALNVEAALRRRASVDIDVQVFRLRYAWADDQVLKIGETQVELPGVASILQNMLGNGSAVQGKTVRITPNNRPGLKGRGLIGPYNQILASAEKAALTSQIAAAQAEARFEATSDLEANFAAAESGAEGQAKAQMAAQISAVIQVDPRLNAVIIRDVKERMDWYRKVIQELDHPVDLVQIKATLIDVDVNHGFQLGAPYNAIWTQNGTQRSFEGDLSTTDVDSLIGIPGNLSLRLADGQVTQFLLNLKALESDGHARMIAKPSVLTLDNNEAFLEESEEFFVRVAGREQVDLFNVIVGTKLYISPHIIVEPDGRRVKLNVRIEDGTRSETASVDEIPVVSRNTVATQTVLLEGQSLLIGGLMREQEVKEVKGIPVLGRIPRLGALFRETVHGTKRVERMILLTPSIVDLPHFEHQHQLKSLMDKPEATQSSYGRPKPKLLGIIDARPLPATTSDRFGHEETLRPLLSKNHDARGLNSSAIQKVGHSFTVNPEDYRRSGRAGDHPRSSQSGDQSGRIQRTAYSVPGEQPRSQNPSRKPVGHSMSIRPAKRK